ncbi:hypothetical protein [Pelagicoccus mobilis]|uniref:Uncharacterized protein n=1 Tax=Pelagicoccus mobilis TaxID=415221 RepID=A0A934S5Q7_9BACT|nr:hypothetical protein [Pelagicoccus mobilis]MBK1879438.1 hypothetical protein [Pelagicoccus mobilis]
MLPALSYTSLEEFEDDYIEALVEEAADVASEHVWWNQPFSLSADKRNPNLLSGLTKLMHRYIEDSTGEARKVEYRDDVLMGAVDTLTLFEMLAFLSKEHEFTWQVFIPIEPRPKPVGRIIEGEIEPKLFELIMPEIDALEITEKELNDTKLHQTLRETHFPQR